MTKMGSGYGSEFHLLRFLGRHRDYFDKRIMSAITGAQEVCWKDYPFGRDGKDGRWKGMDFLDRNPRARDEWGETWPRLGAQPSWDAVGWVLVDGKWEWLLVEAKAHAGELKGEGSKAEPHGGYPQIETFFKSAIKNLGISANADANKWIEGYYRAANLIAMLDFMMRRGETARLVFVYFCGDAVPREQCPQNETEWGAPLAAQSQHLGLDGHKWENRVHQIFIPVEGG